MHFDFSHPFLKQGAGDTSFADAWESLCAELLAYEFGVGDVERIKAPDHGIDILYRPEPAAYQCKSTQQGKAGSIPAGESILSLRRAVENINLTPWASYLFATNAPYSGTARRDIMAAARDLGVSDARVIFRGPDFWSTLCEKHINAVAHRLDYRFRVTEEEVKLALKKAGYYDSYIARYLEALQSGVEEVALPTSHIAAEPVVPMSPHLTVRDLLNVAMAVFGVRPYRATFPDLGTSYRIRLGIVVGDQGVPFDTTIAELKVLGLPRLSIGIRWKRTDSTTDPNTIARTVLDLAGWYPNPIVNNPAEETKIRARADLQDRLWAGVHGVLGDGPRPEFEM